MWSFSFTTPTHPTLTPTTATPLPPHTHTLPPHTTSAAAGQRERRQAPSPPSANSRYAAAGSSVSRRLTMWMWTSLRPGGSRTRRLSDQPEVQLAAVVALLDPAMSTPQRDRRADCGPGGPSASTGDGSLFRQVLSSSPDSTSFIVLVLVARVPVGLGPGEPCALAQHQGWKR